MAKLSNNQVLLRGHELDSVETLRNNGYSIELLMPAYTPHNKNPDLLLDGQDMGA